MRGKDKCRMLRKIRQEIARENDIEFITKDCTFKGECRGTCPKCESELAYLEREMAKRRALGKRIALAGISIGTMAAMTACTPADFVDAIQNAAGGQLQGDVANVVTEPPEVEVLDGEVGGYVEDIEALEGEAVEVTPEPEIEVLMGEEEAVTPEPIPGEPVEYPEDACEEIDDLSGLVERESVEPSATPFPKEVFDDRG